MLHLDPLKRISMKHALNDKYFDDIKPEIAKLYEKMDEKFNWKRGGLEKNISLKIDCT